MKSYGSDTRVGTNYEHLIVPSGGTFPRAPYKHEIFHLLVDLPDVDENGHRVNPWYPRGTYIFDGFKWDKMNDAGRQYRSVSIPAQLVEIKTLPGAKNTVPTPASGVTLAELKIQPSHKKASIAGVASIWVEPSTAAKVWLMVFLEQTLVGLALTYSEPGKPSCLTVTFNHFSTAPNQHVYKLVLAAEKKLDVQVNRCSDFLFNGAVMSSFNVSENS